jgi:hypothetical protein
MKRIPTNDFIEYCRTLNGSEFTTRAGRSRFILNVIGENLEFIPISSKQPRPETKKRIDIVLDHFAESGSFITSDYTKLTVNSTYMLTLIDLYRKKSQNI